MEPVQDDPSSVTPCDVKRPTKIRTHRACVMRPVQDIAWTHAEDIPIITPPPRQIEEPDKFANRKFPLWQRQRP
jgi:hypothetical protein